MKLTFLYCEGPHDVAFIAKLINQLNFSNKDIKIVSELPECIQNIIKQAISNIETESLRIDKPLKAFFPNKVFPLEDNQYVCLFSTGGKEHLQAALENIRKNKLLIGREKSTGIASIQHAFILDADYEQFENGQNNLHGGIEGTLNYLSDEIRKVIPEFTNFTCNSSWVDTDFGIIGNYIFTAHNSKEGTVEDLIDDIIKPTQLVQPSDNFCTAIKDFDEARNAKAKDRTKLQKIKLTCITQAFHPGSSLAVGLTNDKIIDIEKLTGSQVLESFEKFIKG